jgi:hypothetical protein
VKHEITLQPGPVASASVALDGLPTPAAGGMYLLGSQKDDCYPYVSKLFEQDATSTLQLPATFDKYYSLQRVTAEDGSNLVWWHTSGWTAEPASADLTFADRPAKIETTSWTVVDETRPRVDWYLSAGGPLGQDIVASLAWTKPDASIISWRVRAPASVDGNATFPILPPELADFGVDPSVDTMPDEVLVTHSDRVGLGGFLESLDRQDGMWERFWIDYRGPGH